MNIKYKKNRIEKKKKRFQMQRCQALCKTKPFNQCKNKTSTKIDNLYLCHLHKNYKSGSKQMNQTPIKVETEKVGLQFEKSIKTQSKSTKRYSQCS